MTIDVVDAVLYLGPGFLALKLFYLFGAQRPRSESGMDHVERGREHSNQRIGDTDRCQRSRSRCTAYA